MAHSEHQRALCRSHGLAAWRRRGRGLLRAASALAVALAVVAATLAAASSPATAQVAANVFEDDDGVL